MGSKVACATISSANDGDQNILIPQLWPSRHCDSRMVGIKPLDPQDHGIKNGLRDTSIPQCWGSKHSDPAAVAFASFPSSNCEDQTIKSMINIDRVLRIAQPLVLKKVSILFRSVSRRSNMYISGIGMHSQFKEMGFQISSTKDSDQ
jgi:hypothetical protein